MISPQLRWGLGSAVVGSLLLLGACSSNDDRGAFAPTPTPTAIPVTPTPTPTPTPVPLSFSGDTGAFIDFIGQLDPAGDPITINDGEVEFTDTQPDNEPVVVNN